VLVERFKNSPGRARTLFGARWLMQQFGYDPDFAGTTGNSPAAIGNRIGLAVLAAALNDGANEANAYADATGYVRQNEPLVVTQPGAVMADPSRWQPLALRQSITQNGIPLPDGIQSFVGVNARNTTPFALAKPTPITIALDPGPPPQFGSATHAAYIQQALDVIQMSALLDPADAALVDISPGTSLNNPLGTNNGTGRATNPSTGRPYAPNVVKRGDYARVLTEFWADGPSSETPPGHWNVVFNQVTDSPFTERRFGGSGPALSSLEWDVRGYLALNGAMHDAACAAWTLKRHYDSARPISIIRCLGGLGQSSDPAAPSYHPQGLPLMPNLIEVVTAQSSAAGQRHAHLAHRIGKIAIRAWHGNPADAKNQIGGVGWILAEQWVPYQLPTFVSPAFPGYVSGHSTFSRAAAEVLTLLTGSPFFPGGLGEYTFKKDEFLTVELGPSADVALQWATYYDAADQAGLSRIFGGIHPSVDDFTGRRLGSRIGFDAFLKAQAMRRAAAPVAGLINVSSRSRAGAGDNVVIVGFVVDGSTPRTTLLRGIGPALLNHGVAADRCDPDPSIELHRASDDAIVLRNDNWSVGPRSAQVSARASAIGAFPLAINGADAADIIDLAPGGYSVVVRSATPEKRGIQLAEIYGEGLTNLSTRATVGSGDTVLIAGFVLDAPEPTPLLLRGIGPALSTFGVNGALARPQLAIFRSRPGGETEVVATNQGWSDGDKASLVQGAAARAGAFPLVFGSKDAALFVQLSAGAYSVVLGSADTTEGVALLEIYHVK
jgi:hypothetical protein